METTANSEPSAARFDRDQPMTIFAPRDQLNLTRCRLFLAHRLLGLVYEVDVALAFDDRTVRAHLAPIEVQDRLRRIVAFKLRSRQMQVEE